MPVAPNLRILWNFGSLIGLCLAIQILTGLFLAIHYCPQVRSAFQSVVHIRQDVRGGWAMRAIHSNGASIFMFCIYAHIGRGIYHGSYHIVKVWIRGVGLLLLTILAAFTGYVLVWGQIRFWGATVITNLLRAIPYVGDTLVQWVWGGYSVDNPTLNRFFVFHFIVPFTIAILTVIHLVFLHQEGSSNPSSIPADSSKVTFHPYYLIKDFFGALLMFGGLGALIFHFPHILRDPDNFLPANSIRTPAHIKPEWYFLWAYAILRSVPNKLGGVLFMFRAIVVLTRLPVRVPNEFQGIVNCPPAQLAFWYLATILTGLTWIGASPVKYPYELLGQLFTLAYFIFFLLLPLITLIWFNLVGYSGPKYKQW